ncbi:MAG: hypothetical protein IKA58_01655, partial [Clostridia bacterium]|nr:hypothetical protein [Clostridia bacterium]
IGLDESGRIYGVEIKKTAADGTAEKDAFFGISKQYETAEAFSDMQLKKSRHTCRPLEAEAQPEKHEIIIIVISSMLRKRFK